jgi:hypothetical protein
MPSLITPEKENLNKEHGKRERGPTKHQTGKLGTERND